ncbi:melatonin receptor type 1B-B-like [Amphiura filiformis]|uniref:melatonin receptor type 1B-B-like n=1 Tax=Amphiura filiformis TaxID=82378 RepID=UPI003B21DE94
MFDNSSSDLRGSYDTDVREHFIILYGIYRSTFAIIGNIGNTLVILTILTTTKLQTTTNVFVFSLAIADLSITGFWEPVTAIGIFGRRGKFYEDWPRLCAAVSSVCFISCTCSLWNIGAIAVNRYVFICKNQHYTKIFTWKNTIAIAIAIWVICILADLSNHFGWGGHTYDVKFIACSYDRLADYGHVLFTICVFISLPVILIVVCYAQVFLTLRRSSQRVKNQIPAASQQNTRNVNSKDLKLLKMLFTIFITYISFWTFYTLLLLIDFRDNIPAPAYFIAGMMAHMSSSINSILYGVMNKNFRDSYKKILSCGRWKPSAIHPSGGGDSKATGSTSVK